MIAAGAYLSFFTALRIGPLAVVSPVVAAYGGLTVVLSVLIRGETLTAAPGRSGAALATVGVILTGIVFDGGWRGTRIVGRGVALLVARDAAVHASLTAGLATPIRAAGWLPVVLASRLANAATILAVLVVVTLAPAARLRRAAGDLAASPSITGGRGAAAARRPARHRRLRRLRDRARGRPDLDRRPRELVRAGRRGHRRGRAVG